MPVYPRNFDYFRPTTLEEALDLLAEHGDEAALLAGGQSLIPLLKLRLAAPGVVIDLNGLPSLDSIRQGHDCLAIGALARHSDVEESALVCSAAPLVRDAVLMVGDAQIRNRGTVVGALVEADPSGDWGPVLMALGGEISCVSRAGERSICSQDLFQDLYTTAVKPTEIVTEVRLKQPAPQSRGVYLKLERRAGDLAVVGVAVQVDLAPDGRCRDIGIGLAGVAPTPVKPHAAEAVLRGTVFEEAAVAEAIRQVESVIDPWTDERGPAEYKREMTSVYFRRALERARSRAAIAVGLTPGSPSPGAVTPRASGRSCADRPVLAQR